MTTDSIVAGALVDFMDHMTTSQAVLIGRGADKATPRRMLQEWANQRGLDLTKATLDWELGCR